MRAMTKSQLAKAAGVSIRTLRRWLEEPEIQRKLAKYALHPCQKLLPPGAVQIIADHYVIEID